MKINKGQIQDGLMKRTSGSSRLKYPGLNIEQFNSCFDTQKYKEYIDKNVELANSIGFFDTPNFIIVQSIDGSDQR
jgi:hypothetical protein